LDYLKNKAKSGDMACLELTIKKWSLGKWSKSGKVVHPATSVISLECLFDATPDPSLEKREKHSKQAKKDAVLDPSLALSLALSFDVSLETS